MLSAIGSFKFLDNYPYAYNGRIWVIFDSSMVVVTCLVVGDQFIHCEVKWISNGISCYITFVYAMNEAIDRISL